MTKTKLNPAGKLLLVHSMFLAALFALLLVFHDGYYQIIGMAAGILGLLTAFYALVNNSYFEDEIKEPEDDDRT